MHEGHDCMASYCWNMKANFASLDRTTFSESHVHKLEQWIDEMDNHLPELKNFILPVSLSSPCDQLFLFPGSHSLSIVIRCRPIL